MIALCVVFALAIVGSQAQSHGGGQTNLHGICHSNHQQMNEDQVIQTIVRQMDANSDGSVTKPELLLFFADLMGVNLPAGSMDTSALNDTELLEMAAGLSITKHDFTQAWHNRFHDSVEFIGATFDALEGQNKDGTLDANEIEAIVNDALMNYDPDGDGILQEKEMVTYLERIYKNC